MNFDLFHWFISLKVSDKIAIVIPVSLAFLSGIAWFITTLFDKKEPHKTINKQSPKYEQKGLINSIGKITNIFK